MFHLLLLFGCKVTSFVARHGRFHNENIFVKSLTKTCCYSVSIKLILSCSSSRPSDLPSNLSPAAVFFFFLSKRPLCNLKNWDRCSVRTSWRILNLWRTKTAIILKFNFDQKILVIKALQGFSVDPNCRQ